MAIPSDFLDELSARTNMLELVSRYVPMQRVGARWFGRCPFHSEKTGSFNVSPENGVFYCFGCHAGGGAIQFVMQIENLEYIDAVALLAKLAGLEMPEDDDPGARIRRNRVLSINQFAARWFYDNLGRPEGKTAVAYMRERGIKPETARRFGLGCAPDVWDGLLTAAHAQGISQDEMMLSGLCSRGAKGNVYDAFKNRLMFPVFDVRGNVIAFSGRALDDAPAKYKNSPETPVYQKRNTLYAIQLAKKSKRPYWILCEGNIDVVMLHQSGFDCAVATCGTALTDTQSRLMARMTGEVFLSYDSDEAGKKASQKAVNMLEKTGVKVRVLRLTGAKDPDEYIRQYGATAFEKLLTGSENPIEFRLSALSEGHDLTTDEGKISYLREAVQMLTGLQGEAERQVYAGRIAKKLGVDTGAVLRDAETAIRRKQKKETQSETRAVMRRTEAQKAPAEELAAALLLRRPDLLDDCPLCPEDFSDEAYKALFLCLREGKNPMQSPNLAPTAARLLSLAVTDGAAEARQALRDCIERISQDSLARRAQSEGKDPLMEKFERLKQQKKYGG